MSLSESSSAFWETSWQEITRPASAKERAVHEQIKSRLGGIVPLRVWSGFEFISQEGAAFEVDLLVLGPSGLFLIELFWGSGEVAVDERHWSWQGSGTSAGVEVMDSPYWRASAKAARLQALLEQQLFKKFKAHAPKVTPLVLLCEPLLTLKADHEGALIGVTSLRPHHEGAPELMALIASPDEAARALGQPEGAAVALTQKVLERVQLALDHWGLAETQRNRRVKEWRCVRLLETSENHQDYLAIRQGTQGPEHRLRIFISDRDTSPTRQQKLYQAAQREFEVLQSLKHHSILKVEQWLDKKQSPALVFETTHSHARLDQLLKMKPSWSTKDKLTLLRQITEAIKYAHRQNVVHRALTPSCVLVEGLGAGLLPHAKVYNWQMSFRASDYTGTRHIQAYMDQSQAIYLAPEITMGQLAAGPQTDVWGLGCIAYALFTGQPPAPDVGALHARLMHQQGLRASAIIDGVPESLDELIFKATHPLPRERTPSAEAFLLALERDVWPKVVAKAREEGGTRSLDEVEPHDVLEDRWVVQRRLGSGASAQALLVHDEQTNRDVVLKIAHTPSDDVRLLREAEELRKLHDSPTFVTLFETAEIQGRTALALSYAGPTLRERLNQRRGGLPQHELRRFGEDLCAALVALEHAKLLHRDIKPANLGVLPQDKSRERLVLFDLSLAGTDVSSIQAGTVAYRDPFLPIRKRWDEHADMYAAAVTLHEMATGTLPRWGDGDSSPALDPSMTLALEPEFFHATVRDELVAFFHRALSREVSDRYLTAADMQRAWVKLFETTAHTTTNPSDKDPNVLATPDTPLQALTCSDEARQALVSLGLTNVGDFVSYSLQNIYFSSGLPDHVRRELTELHKKLSRRMPSLRAEGPIKVDPKDLARATLDQCLKQEVKSPDLLDALLGGWQADAVFPWPTYAQLAQHLKQPLEDFSRGFDEAAQHWAKSKLLGALRQDIAQIVERGGGVMSSRGLAGQLIYARASDERDQQRRLIIAQAAARLAAEAQLHLGEQEPGQGFGVKRLPHEVFIFTRPALADALDELGQRADELANEDSLRSQSRAYAALSEVLQQHGANPLPLQALLYLAAEASSSTALSSLNELYPKGMSAERVLRLSKGALFGANQLTPEELQQLLDMRYPEAERQPAPEALQLSLDAAHIKLHWKKDIGCFVNVGTYNQGTPTLQQLTYVSSARSTTSDVYSLDVDLDAFDQDLRQAYQWGGFRALLVEPSLAHEALRRVTTTVSALKVIDVDALWLDAITQLLQSNARLTLDKILSADAPDAPSEDKVGFGHILRHKLIPAVERALDAYAGQDLLLINVGLLGRYHEQGSMKLLERLSDKANTPQGPRSLWLLLPSDHQRQEPFIAGSPVPRASDSQVTRIPRRWLRRA